MVEVPAFGRHTAKAEALDGHACDGDGFGADRPGGSALILVGDVEGLLGVPVRVRYCQFHG